MLRHSPVISYDEAVCGGGARKTEYTFEPPMTFSSNFIDTALGNYVGLILTDNQLFTMKFQPVLSRSLKDFACVLIGNLNNLDFTIV